MSLLILGRTGESKILTTLGHEIEIRIVRIETDRVLLDVATRISGQNDDKARWPEMPNAPLEAEAEAAERRCSGSPRSGC